MATPLYVLSKKPKLVLYQKKGATSIKLGMQTQLDSVNNMGCIPLGHTSSFKYIRTKNDKNVLLNNTWT